MGLIPGSGSSPGEGNGTRLQCSCLEKSMDRGSWWASPWCCKESDTTEHKHLIIFLTSTNGEPFRSAGFLKWHLSQFPQSDCPAAPSLTCPGNHLLSMAEAAGFPPGSWPQDFEDVSVWVLNHCLRWTCFPCIWLKGPPGVRSKGLCSWPELTWQWLLLLVTSSSFGIAWWTWTPIWQAAFQKLIQI